MKYNFNMTPCLIFLTAKNNSEAGKLTRILLTKKLVSCVKKILIDSSFLWNKKISASKEILLIMDSVSENFNLVDKNVKKIHSYDTYTLFMVKADRLNKKAQKWLKNEIGVGERT